MLYVLITNNGVLKTCVDFYYKSQKGNIKPIQEINHTLKEKITKNQKAYTNTHFKYAKPQLVQYLNKIINRIKGIIY